MDFDKIANKCEVSISKLKIKNKGSIVKLGDYYINMYTLLIEKYGLECQESEYMHTEKGEGIKANLWKWVAYKKLDNFARLKFKFNNNAFFVKGDKVLGIFSVEYILELDYKRTWRDSALLRPFLKRYLQLFYQNQILQYIERYAEELQSIKEIVRKELNVSVFD